MIVSLALIKGNVTAGGAVADRHSVVFHINSAFALLTDNGFFSKDKGGCAIDGAAVGTG